MENGINTGLGVMGSLTGDLVLDGLPQRKTEGKRVGNNTLRNLWKTMMWYINTQKGGRVSGERGWQHSVPHLWVLQKHRWEQGLLGKKLNFLPASFPKIVLFFFNFCSNVKMSHSFNPSFPLSYYWSHWFLENTFFCFSFSYVIG